MDRAGAQGRGAAVAAEEEGWQGRLLAAGAAHLQEVGPLVDGADPDGRVAPRSRRLCAALGLLSRGLDEALGGTRRAAEVGAAGAALSLLTKVDDEVIDGPAFHGGMAADRRALRARTAAYLEPTLASLRAARPASGEPRCALAADVGRRLRRLTADPLRLARLLEVIAEGWRTQVDAVEVLTSHPGAVSLAEVAGVTRRISGLWLLMVALVGSLPEDAARAPSADEEEAFLDWGFHIQRADALADLEKDGRDGLVSTFAGRLAWEREPARYLPACARGDAAAVYAMVARHRIDEECVRGGVPADALAARLAGLGEVRALLRWIHGFLVHRYLAHPRCLREREDPAFRALWERRAAWAAYVESGGRRAAVRATPAPAPVEAPPRLAARGRAALGAG
ncbi:MAG: hypothetical protein IT372_34095 [Polyangiaceae bacterium]|nr:hypothetical protein [Polyangiaceae bacterium]